MTCKHMQFAVSAEVHRLVDEKDPEKVTGYAADIRIRCAECKLPFEFLGLEPGVDNQGARVSIDGQEAHIAITPLGERPSPLDRMMVGIRRVDA